MKEKMLEKEFTMGDLEAAIATITQLKEKFSGQYKKGKNLVLTANVDGEPISLTFGAETSDPITVKGGANAIAWFEKTYNGECSTIQGEDINGTPFEGWPTNSILSMFGRCKNLFLEISKMLKKCGISKVVDQPSMIGLYYSEPTLTIMGHSGLPKRGVDIDKLFEEISKLGYTTNTVHREYGPPLVDKERPVKLEVAGACFGEYYRDRNLINLYINPFNGTIYKKGTDLSDYDWLLTFFEVLEGLKIEKMDSTNMSFKITLTGFVRHQQEIFDSYKNKEENCLESIRSYESALTNYYRELNTARAMIAASSKTVGQLSEHIFEEFKKLKEVPFVESVELDRGIVLKYRPTFIKGIVDGKTYDMYLGSIRVRINTDLKLEVMSDYPVSVENARMGCPHPHANEQGSPCLGTGEGASAIHRLLGEFNLSDFAFVFWMWIHKWRPEDCYVKPESFLNDRLRQGLPVFNGTKKVEFVPSKTITKADNYGQNIKLFESMKRPIE